MQTELITGVAQVLAAAGLGVWRPDGSAYQAGETAIVDTDVPDRPDRLIVLTTYPVDDEVGTDTTVGLQVRTRAAGADPRPCRDLDDHVFELLHGRTDWRLPTGVHVVSCLRRSSANLGTDQSGRWERSSNYYLLTHWPAPFRAA